ncbi:MAG: hypothetical protein ACK5PT_21695, partial [Cereibacter sp.]
MSCGDRKVKGRPARKGKNDPPPGKVLLKGPELQAGPGHLRDFKKCAPRALTLTFRQDIQMINPFPAEGNQSDHLVVKRA